MREVISNFIQGAGKSLYSSQSAFLIERSWLRFVYFDNFGKSQQLGVTPLNFLNHKSEFRV